MYHSFIEVFLGSVLGCPLQLVKAGIDGRELFSNQFELWTAVLKASIW